MAKAVEEWMAVSKDTRPDALVFPSERGTFATTSCAGIFGRSWRRLAWGGITFQVLRRTQASLGHNEGIDPKVGADQRGHAIGVSLNTYTTTDHAARLHAVAQLEQSLNQVSA